MYISTLDGGGGLGVRFGGSAKYHKIMLLGI